MKLLKKSIAFALAAIMMFSFNLNVFAADNMAAAEMGIQAAAARIVEENPDAEVLVVDNTLHIVVDDLSEIPGFANTGIVPNASYETSVVSAEGGTFQNFDLPWHAYLGFAPIYQVYMPEDVVDALEITLSDDPLFEQIVETIRSLIASGFATPAIVAAISANFGITISSIVVDLMITWFLEANSNAEYDALVNAQEKSETGKVSVVYGTTTYGYPAYYYSPWDNNVCTTYGGYEALWFEGEYHIS